MEIFLQKVCFCYISYFTQDLTSVQYSPRGGSLPREPVAEDEETRETSF